VENWIVSSSNNIPDLQALIGTRFVMLDSIRDGTSGFLGTPGGPSTDFGLGVTDNPLFFFTTYYVPGQPTVPRPYPIKLLWIGSPQGDVNYTNEAFNIYVADVVPDNFYPGAAPNTGGPSTSWLVNPRLVLSIEQAVTDITTWFDANYPGGASGGVGNGNSGSNDTYGTLAGGDSAVGNVTKIGVPGLEGQFWPIYDTVDDTILLYFSVKTPNCNTLSIYCYKLTDTEFGAPATSSEFLGGLYAPGWTNINTYFSSGATLLSSHRFSILSPDPLAVVPRSSGTQNAVFLYSYGVIDGATADHGRVIAGSIITDVHTSPLSPGIAVGLEGSPITSQLGAEQFYTADKLGSISAANSVESSTPGYVCVYNSPLEIDRRSTSAGSVVLSEMALRILYYNPASGLSLPSEALRVNQTPEALGTCRPQFTDLPDGKTKILYANFSWDQYLNCGYEYLAPDALSPKRQSKIRVSNTLLPDTIASTITCYSYGKNKMIVKVLGGGSNNLAAYVNQVQIIGAPISDPSNGFGFGSFPFVGSKFIHQKGAFSAGFSSIAETPITEFIIENLDAYIMIRTVGPGTTPIFYADLID
jgi:hypothetical protein